MALKPLSREEMDANHRRARSTAQAAEASGIPKIRNVRPALDLGNLVYFTFRGRAYGVPPLPWRAGLELQTLWLEATSLPNPLTPTTGARYREIVAALPRLLWRYCRPVGWVRRLLKAVRIHPNPFEGATEGDLVGLAGFFLNRRMRSSINLQPNRPAELLQ